MEKRIEIPKNYFPVADVDHIFADAAPEVDGSSFTDAGYIDLDGLTVTNQRVCSNTLIPFIKEQEAKKRQQMKKRGKRK